LSEDELLVHLAAADCFVLPSTNRAESFGISVLDAQAMAQPAVVTDVGTGTVESIAPGDTGLVVPAGDSGALAAAINDLLADLDRAAEMGERGRERVLACHSAQAAAAQLRDVYAGAAGGSN
jgi:glycosyltransferase involved in cell wall biosynthesis